MERLIDVFSKVGRHYLWTYNVTLGGPDFHPSVIDFEREAIRRAGQQHKKEPRALIAEARRRSL
jgi:hypothetical protein